jgi:erythromycin esterase-like protein
MHATKNTEHAIRHAAHPLEGGETDFDPLLKLIGGSRFILIGEATHGSCDFFRLRAQLTKRLIMEKAFNAVAVEADWPDAA